ncbi:hypothetical protein [Comamonas sp.]|uniref:hypothetical protein n=1 Tax=Comamonas sp. TaxID=34028 RepID=UPI003A8D3B63
MKTTSNARTQSIVIYGPQGCGKATHAARLQQHFGLNKVYDGDCAAMQSAKDLPRFDTLILANTAPNKCPVRSMSFEKAMHHLNAQAPRAA